MDERLEKALNFSNFLDTQNNQKNIFYKQYQENLIHYAFGHKFVASPQLINFLYTFIQEQENTCVLIDENNTPVEIPDVKSFAKELLGVYVFASRKYAKDFNDIKTHRSVEGLTNLWQMVFYFLHLTTTI